MLRKYTTKDVGKQKFVVGNYNKWEMLDNKNIKLQINEYLLLLDSYDIWHARLGHVSSGYFKKMQTLGLINNIDYSCLSKCQICATSKLTRETCGLVTRETKLLELIHSDLGDLKKKNL